MHITEKTPFRDLVLMADQRQFAGTEDVYAQATFDTHFDLGFDLEFTPVHPDLCQAIVRACSPPGENFEIFTDLGDWLYAVVRYDAPRDPLYHWDSDQRLQLCIALSRLVHPTSLGFDFAVRIIGNPLTSERIIVPGPVHGFGSRAWVSDASRDWLTPAHAIELKDLLTSFFGRGLLPRPKRALWYHEYASRSYELDVRWMFIATALESMLNTDSRNATDQFIQRIRQLAERLGLPALSKTRANDMYRFRSKIVHGQSFDANLAKHRTVYAEMETLLRVTLRRCVMDAEFEKIFAEEATISAEFPI